LQRPAAALRQAALAATRDLPSNDDHYSALFGLYDRLLAADDPRDLGV
jgi:hypothetical protein